MEEMIKQNALRFILRQLFSLFNVQNIVIPSHFMLLQSIFGTESQKNLIPSMYYEQKTEEVIALLQYVYTALDWMTRLTFPHRIIIIISLLALLK